VRDLARRSEKDRAELFRATAQTMRVHEAIVEKDFWVCWILDYLFADSPWKNKMAFKGGTSLSKAYGAIERFSEDIDLILDWQLLGYAPDEPWGERTPTKQDAFGKEANRRAEEFLAGELAPVLGEDLKGRVEAEIKVAAKAQDVFIQYPRAFSLEAIHPEIRLEIGPLAAWVPNEEREIRSYAAERFPQLFTQPHATVRTITIDRTFWEKATILHQEAHRGPERPLPPRYSRHYYDMCRLSRLNVRKEALGKMELLQEVVQFKMRFYRCSWAMYEEAKPGGFKLLPPPHHVDELRRDYRSMRAMLFGVVPAFDEIMRDLAALENSINESKGEGP